MSTDIESVPPTTYASVASSYVNGNPDDDSRMIAAPMVVLAALYMDMGCTRCGLYRHEHVRGMNPPGKRACSKFIERRPERRLTVEEKVAEGKQRGLGVLRPVHGLLVMALLILAVIVLGAVT